MKEYGNLGILYSFYFKECRLHHDSVCVKNGADRMKSRNDVMIRRQLASLEVYYMDGRMNYEN